MPRYFFQCHNGAFLPDTEGTELPDADAARTEAVLFMAGMLKDRPDRVCIDQDLQLMVTDEVGSMLCTVVVRYVEQPAAGG